MNKHILEDPTNRVVCVFDEVESAISAQKSLADAGSPTDKIRVVSNESRAEDIDTTSKYFADTHVEIQRYHDELRKGATLLIVPVTDANNREEIHQILKANGARMVTHFGEWVTEMMK